jgi:hypothetical protein
MGEILAAIVPITVSDPTVTITIKPMLFAGESFYPIGGWDDFKGFFDDVESAKKWIEEQEPDGMDKWAHIVVDSEIVLAGRYINSYGVDLRMVWVWTPKEE